jgi:hypothetical protein
MSCQLTEIRANARTGSPLRKFDNFRVRLLREIKKRGGQLIKKALENDNHDEVCSLPFSKEIQNIKPGDIVRVRSRKEIRKLLAISKGKSKGCSFMREMYKCCGREFTVLKAVESFFDEAKQKMCKCRNAVILEGAVCSGRQRLYLMKCDRNCFYFWQTEWLEKVS